MKAYESIAIYILVYCAYHSIKTLPVNSLHMITKVPIRKQLHHHHYLYQ